MSVISNYAFSGGMVPNPTDPLIIHLRIKSNEQSIYDNLTKIFKSYDNIMLGKKYSYETILFPNLLQKNSISLLLD